MCGAGLGWSGGYLGSGTSSTERRQCRLTGLGEHGQLGRGLAQTTVFGLRFRHSLHLPTTAKLTCSGRDGCLTAGEQRQLLGLGRASLAHGHGRERSGRLCLLRGNIELALVLRLHGQSLKVCLTLCSFLLCALLLRLLRLLLTEGRLQLLGHDRIRHRLLFSEADSSGCLGSELERHLLHPRRLCRCEQIHLLGHTSVLDGRSG